MKKIFTICLILILALILCGCEDVETVESNTKSRHFYKICIEGKEFIVGGHGFSINLDFDGKPIKCEMKK